MWRTWIWRDVSACTYTNRLRDIDQSLTLIQISTRTVIVEYVQIIMGRNSLYKGGCLWLCLLAVFGAVWMFVAFFLDDNTKSTRSEVGVVWVILRSKVKKPTSMETVAHHHVMQWDQDMTCSPVCVCNFCLQILCSMLTVTVSYSNYYHTMVLNNL